MASNITKFTSEEDRNKIKIHLIILNLLLMLLTLFAIFSARHLYSERIQALNLKENRFITTEWYLLQTLVNKTEQELREKDREIEALRLRYARLLRNDSSSDLLTKLEAEIEEALADRRAIIDRRLQNSGDTPSIPPASTVRNTNMIKGYAESRTNNDALLTRLRERMRELADQLEAEQEQISELEKEISNRPAAPAIQLKAPLAEYERQIQSLKAGSTEVCAQIQQRLQELENESDGAVEGLISYQLVRALLSTPAIRSQYPELLADLDAYIEELSRQEQNKGLRMGYEHSLELMSSVRKKFP